MRYPYLNCRIGEKGHMGSFINYVDMEGEGISQMSILLHKPYLVKLSTKGRGSKMSTCFMDDPLGILGISVVLYLTFILKMLHCRVFWKIIFISSSLKQPAIFWTTAFCTTALNFCYIFVTLWRLFFKNGFYLLIQI